MKTKIYSKEVLISLLKEWALKNGKTPNRRLINENAFMPSDMAYRVHFGSWGKALVEAGFTPTKAIPVGARKGTRNKKHTRVISHGYVHLYIPTHIEAMKNGYVREHRMLISDFLKRKIKPNEEVHHINGVKSDNRIENLMLMTKAEHTSLTHKGSKKVNSNNSIKCTAQDCETLTGSKYGLCRKHYKKEWARLRSIHTTPNLLT